MRLRRAGRELTLTVKGGRGESRSETEVEVDQATFDELWPETEGCRIDKARQKIELEGGLVAEVDRYAGDLEGAVVVEVEFESTDAAAGFWPPSWFGRELTGDDAWANQSLAVAGLPEKRLEYRLRPGEEGGSGVCRVVTARTAQAAAAVRAAGEAVDPARQVHEARKSLKKARSALRLLRGVIADEERKAANGTCREAARRLSGARDAEVKVMTLDVVASGMDTDWRSDLEREAAAHRGDLTPESLADVAKQIESVARRFRGRRIPGADEAVAGNLGRTYRRGRKAMKAARKGGGAESFHGWRKRAKDLRYQLEIVEPRLPKQFSKVRKQAEDLADMLGDLHDFDVLAEDLASRVIDEGERRVLDETIAEARDRQAEDCLKAGDRAYDRKPAKFTNRICDSLVAEG